MRKSTTTLALGAVLTAGVLLAPSALADTVTQAVTEGARTASFTDVTLQGVTASHSPSNGTGTLSLAANDLSGTGAGWHVTASVSEFVYDGANGGESIPAANFSVTPGAVTGLDGALIAGVTPATGGALNNVVPVLSAAVGSGVGDYTQAIDATLTVPADSRAGTYTGTLTTTIDSAP